MKRGTATAQQMNIRRRPLPSDNLHVKPTDDSIRTRAEANYAKVLDELHKKFQGLKEGCFPRPRGNCSFHGFRRSLTIFHYIPLQFFNAPFLVYLSFITKYLLKKHIFIKMLFKNFGYFEIKFEANSHQSASLFFIFPYNKKFFFIFS